MKTEFGFDTVQVAKNRYASQQYHEFIGFQVSKPLLERVFPVVYGVELKDVLTQVALQLHKNELMSETPNFEKKKFLYRLSRSDYEKEWGKDYKKPSFGTRVLSTLLRFMPKVGPFKWLAFNNPTTKTEDLYITSINTTVDQYRVLLEEVRNDKLVLPNYDFDSGLPTRAAEYSLTDDAYAKLLDRLAKSNFYLTSPELRTNILEFYSDLSAKFETKKDLNDWRDVLSQLEQLKIMTPTPLSTMASESTQ